ncbi:siderophore-interacting protein [Shinella pollutisoli]|uniref:Siderophore-interacting protein n=1 Tax=Shinella pollutisoli TaxID=2250594 RepID=A0ABV7DM87_9HYPH|nr:siderophore-interacting protein [Shinella pollutisoli]
MNFRAHATAHFPCAEAARDAIFEDFTKRFAEVEDGATVSRDGAAVSLAVPEGDRSFRAIFTATGDDFGLDATAKNLDRLIGIKSFMASQLLKYAEPHSPSIIWQGDASELTTHPGFRLMRVVSTRNVTPHMKRLTLIGEDLDRFATLDGLHVGLVIPRKQDTAALSLSITLSPDGRLILPQGDDAPDTRTYTIRSVDTAAGTLDIDFVVHDDAGPGSAFAERAKPGDVVGLLGPAGAAAPLDRDWYLLAGDETAIPAIARILEALPERARGVAFIEVADAAEEQPIATRSGIEVRWLHRNGACPGATNLLVDAVRGTHFPAEGASLFAWAACEIDAFKEMRAYLRKERGLKKGESLVACYWRKGVAEA